MPDGMLQSIYDDPSDISRLTVSSQDGKTPEQASELLDLEGKTGLPSDFIENNLEEVRKTAASSGFDAEAFRNNNPKFAAWMAKNPNHYAFAKDDKNFFSQIEMKSDSFGEGWKSQGKLEELSAISQRGLSGEMTSGDAVRMDRLKEELGVPKGETIGTYMARKSGYGWGQGVKTTLVGAQGAVYGLLPGAALGSIAGGVGAIPGSIAGASAGAGTALSLYTYNMESGFAWDEYRGMVDTGGNRINDNVIRTVARGVGVLNAAIEVGSDAMLVSLIPGLKNIIGGLGKNAAKQAVRQAVKKALASPTTRQILLSGFGKLLKAQAIEAGEEGVQSMVSSGGREVSQALSGQEFAPDSFTEDLKNAGAQMWDAAVSTGLGPGLFFGGADVMANYSKVHEARATENWYKALGEGVKESKAFKNLPDKAQEAMAEIIKDGPYQNTYVDPKTWVEYWQSQNIDPREIASEVLGDTEQYDAAVAAGHDIVIPTERYARKIAPTDHNAFFSQEIRRSPDAMNAREATQFFQSANDAANNQNAQTPQDGQDLSQGVYDDVSAQLRSTGAYTERQIDAYAKTWQSIFRTLGQRSGTDPMALYAKYKPSIKKLDSVPAVTGEQMEQESRPEDFATAEEYVASKGSPIYHGTDAVFDTFDLNKSKAFGKSKFGHWFTENKEFAGSFGGNVKEGFVNVNNPKIISSDEWNLIREKHAKDGDWFKSWKDRLVSEGYDGLKIKGSKEKFAGQEVENPTILAAFNDAQVKTKTQLTAEWQAARNAKANQAIDEIRLLDKNFTIDVMSNFGRIVLNRITNKGEKGKGNASKVLNKINAIADKYGLDVYLQAQPMGEGGLTKPQLISWYSRHGYESIDGSDEMVRKAQPMKFEQAAYHGSPHEFEKFSLHKIGSGEGHQAYGWGLYFAGAKEVAEYYRQNVKDNKYLDEINQRMSKLVDEIDKYKTGEYGKFSSPKGYELKAEYDRLMNEKLSKKGRVYTVEIPEDSAYLDIDKTFREQSPEAQKAIIAALKEMKYLRPEDNGPRQISNAWKSLGLEHGGMADKDSGRILYAALVNHFKSAELASKYLASQGIAGLKYFNQVSRKDGKGSSNYVIFDDKLVKVLEYEQDKQGPRGRIYFNGLTRQPNIDLFKNADLSTFLHESAHLYLEVLGDLATAPTVNEQLKGDYQTILNWLGVKDRNEITVQQHEQFARGFEAYLMEGKAPSVGLRAAFMRFKVWLTRLYRQMQALNVQLTDQVRGAFDRIIATDEEIKQAEEKQNFQPLFVDPKKMGMNDEQAAKYLQATEEARISAEDELLRKMMNEILREEKSWWKDELAKVEKEVTVEAYQKPEYIATSVLQKAQKPDGTPADAVKISRKDISKFSMKEMLPRGISADDGLPVDVVAELFGYANGQELLKALADAPAMKDYIQGTSLERMRQMHGEFLTNREALESAAMKAIHNDKRAEVLRTELEYLAKNDMPVLKDVMRRVTRRMPRQEEVRIWAEETISKQAVKDIRPSVYSRAERNFARQAGEFLAKGDLNAAFDAKLRELYNHELFAVAMDAKDDVEESVYNFSKFFKSDEKIAKKRDMNLVNAGRAILSQFGIGKADKTSFSYLDAVKNYDPEFYQEISDMVVGATQAAANYKDVTYDDFTKMKNSVNALWDLAKRTRQILIDGKLMDRDEALKELEDRLDVITKPGERAGYSRDVTNWDKTKMGLLGMRSSLRRVESWVTAIDGGKQGPFRRYVWNPISDAISQYREVKKGYLVKYLEIAKLVEKTMTNEPIIARELVGKNGVPYTFSGKASLLHAVLHSGNDSNLSKLLRGRGWGDVNEAGQLDTSRWDAFISRMWKEGVLTKADYEFAQGIWDLLEEMKPEAQKAHKDMYGYYFSEITATPVMTPWGEFRGGYVPAIADPFIVPDAAMREEREAIEKSDNSFMFPTTGRGFSKARVEKYARPLALDLRYIPSHIDKVLRFTHIEPRIKDVGRIIMNKQFREMLNELDPTVAGDMLVPWLQRSALQKVEAKGKGGHLTDTIFREIRKRTGLQIMTANVVNTLQQFTGFSIGMVKVKPQFFRNALWNYVRGPAKMSEDISDKSVYMRNRMNAKVMEIQSTLDDILLNPSKYDQARDFANKHGYFLQQHTQNIVDHVVWAGAYEQAVDEGATELEAVRQADSAVRETQGSFAPEDVSRFESGTPFIRAFTMFYSYFNMQANLLGSEFTNIVRDMGLKKGAGRALYVYTMGFMIPAVLSEMIVRAMSGKDADQDDDGFLNDILDIFFGSQFRTVAAMTPGLGQVVTVMANRFNKKWYDDRITTSPAVTMIEKAAGAPQSIYKAIAEDGSKKRAIQDSLTLLGMLSGMPLAPLARPLGYLSDVSEGVAEPENPVDFARGLVTGK